jgi:hypothetical protein
MSERKNQDSLRNARGSFAISRIFWRKFSGLAKRFEHASFVGLASPCNVECRPVIH